MASSLASQLQRIAAASTNTLNTRKLKAIHSTSLIFEPAHAATQDLDTIYSIALEGFRELCALDARFFVFERGLFSESSKEVDRLLLTKPEVQDLNASIEAFLELVSGRLLLRPALKAVEWLVRRFRVQDQNTTALLLAFLPYHAHATLFPQVLSIINPKDLSAELKFLRPYLKPPAALPRHVITHTLSHRRETLDLLVAHVTSVVQSRRESHQLLAFFAAVVVEAVSLMCDAARSPTSSGITEETVLQKALPLLEETFKAKKTPEFQVGGYMLATVVVSKIPMKDEVLLALMGAIVGGWSAESVTPALACLALIAQARTGPSAGRLQDAVTAGLLAIEDIVQRLQEMGKKYRVDNLVTGLCNGILEKIGKSYGSKELEYVVELLEEAKLGPKGRKAVLSRFVDVAQKLQGFEDRPEDEDDVRDALATSLVKWSEQGNKKLGKTLQLVFEENKVDIEMLELALRTVIERPALPAPKSEKPKAIKAAPAKEAVTLEQLLETIPDAGLTVSFLEPRKTENKKLFEHLQQMFLLAIRKPDGVQTIFAHDIFTNKNNTVAFTISLLARIWTFTANPVIARAIALQHAVKIIKANAKAKVDYQALIPFALAALADPAERVRRETTHLVTALLEIYQQLDEAGAVTKKKRKSKGGDLMVYWGLDTVYGAGSETDNVKVLDAADARKFLEVVLAKGLQECVLDSAYITSVIENGLGATKKDQTDGKLKSSVKTNVLSFLCSHAVNVPSLSIQLRLLTMLNRVANGPSSRTEFLLPSLQKWIARPLEENVKYCEEERVDIREFEEQVVSVVEAQDGTSELVSILSTDVGGEGLVSAAAKRIITVWGSLEEGAKVATATKLLKLNLNDSEQKYSGSSEALDILRAVKLPTEAFQQFLEEARIDLKSTLGLNTAAQPKRRRVSAPGVVNADKEEQIAAAVRRITIVAEILDGQEPRNHASVLATLFSVLGDLGSVEFSGITYLQSILLSCARDIIKGYKATNTDLNSSSVRADVLVSCIRSTTSPQVQNSALLLLSDLADISPDTVKHSVMPIFTFMGANTLRQDDEYSAHVIEQTVQRVIPPLVKSLQEQGGSLITAGAELISTFVASYKHVPVHRRLRLFQSLTETLGPTEFLFAIVAKLAGKYAVGEGEGEVKEFVSMLSGGFTAEVQMGSVVKYLSTIKDVLKPQPQGGASILFASEEDGRDVPAQEMARRLLAVLKAFLGSERLKARVAKSLKTSREDASSLRGFFSQAMEQTMALGDEYAFNKAIATEAAEVMSQLLELLSVIEFVKVIESLISQVDSPFRSSALTTFKNRVVSEYRTDATSRNAILDLAPKIAAIITAQDSPKELKADALLCILAVTQKFGKQEQTAVSALTEAVASIGALRSPDSGLRVLALVCLTHMTTVLGGRIIPILPKTVPIAIEYLQAAVRSEDSSVEVSMVHNAVFKYLEELVKNVPSFMTSYLTKVLPLAAAAWDQDDLDEGLPYDVRRNFLVAVASRMELRTVIGAITKAWKPSCAHGSDPIRDLVEMVQKGIQVAPKASVQKCSQVLLQFFITALDARREPEVEDVAPLEDLIMKVCLDMVYKLNDSIFKPMFLRLVEWGTEDLRSSDDEEGKWTRIGVIWKLMEALSGNLKSLVTDYHTPLLPSAISTLTSPTPHTFATTSVLRALHQGMLNDSSDFWQSPTHFDPLLPALLAILPTFSELAIPCLTELAAAAQSEEHSKSINTGVLALMRDESEVTRLAAVRAMMGLYARLGEDWLGLLPETVPFIAELMEDDDETVERETQRLIKRIEEYLGDGELQGMLT
ncbi:armadillo-type protein [Tricharina praecox]|uniref:armadillo-type protein n=1 Tax=Tricharina praecox TaxID=43433 RepID=UPI002220999A|nr:armadillo-type protein [Tricharina praecox]KAI5848875.1 armadillo-type protein [Tricharina praecox]